MSCRILSVHRSWSENSPAADPPETNQLDPKALKSLPAAEQFQELTPSAWPPSMGPQPWDPSIPTICPVHTLKGC